MPDDTTLATILAICDLMKSHGSGVESAVEAYQRAMKDVMDYRRAKGITEVGGPAQTIESLNVKWGCYVNYFSVLSVGARRFRKPAELIELPHAN